MTRGRFQAVWLAALLALGGCGNDGQDELRAWMTQLRATTKPRALQITEPKQFVPSNYTAEGGADPFAPQRLTQALRKGCSGKWIPSCRPSASWRSPSST